jgi:hypothetical protein
MTMRLRVMGLLVTAAIAVPVAVAADTPTTPSPTHRVHKAKKEVSLPPLPSGTRGPVPQVPLDAIPPIAPQVSYQDGMLTINAPNSTLGDILRSVRKHTSADIEVPPTASERVVTHLGPAPAREVIAELLNGSRFNYVLLGSPENANDLVKVVLVARTASETAAQSVPADGTTPVANAAAPADAADAESADDNNNDETAEQAPEPEAPAEQPKTPQQMLQEMQQRQLMLQQQQQQNGQPGGFPPGMPNPRIQPQNQDQQ